MIISVGIDVVDIARVERMLERRRDRLLDRLFTPGERAVLSARAFPARHAAARIAAKEAAYKALAGSDLARGIGWREVEVQSRPDGAPMLRLHGRAAQRFAELGGVAVHLSLTHSGTTAAAVVIIDR